MIQSGSNICSSCTDTVSHAAKWKSIDTLVLFTPLSFNYIPILSQRRQCEIPPESLHQSSEPWWCHDTSLALDRDTVTASPCLYLWHNWQTDVACRQMSASAPALTLSRLKMDGVKEEEEVDENVTPSDKPTYRRAKALRWFDSSNQVTNVKCV